MYVDNFKRDLNFRNFCSSTTNCDVKNALETFVDIR